MDEPFSGLDPVNTALLKDVLRELSKEGRTILFSTHRMDQVEKLCSSICLVNRGEAVLQGKLKEIKGRYGRSNVQIEYEGSDEFLRENGLVQSFNNYGNYVEVRMVPGADSQKLLQAVAQRSRVNKFELVEPSLEDIFIDTVGKTDA
jgi:ABC-2 type transport system ATP-binding protein